MIDDRVRARVLEVEGEVATLGIYVQGTWARIHARTEVALTKGGWLTGHLVAPADGSMVFFKVLSVDEDVLAEDAPSGPARLDGLDLEA